MRLRHIRIRLRLPLLAGVLVLLAVASVAFLSYQQARSSLVAENGARLRALAAAKTQRLADYLRTLRQDLAIQAGNKLVKKALQELAIGRTALGDQATAKLQKAYIENNPHPPEARDELKAPGDGSIYSRFHVQHHPWFRDLRRERGYGDIYLLDPAGNLVYTVAKMPDFATNVLDGAWRDSGLAQAFRAAIEAEDPARAHFVDFAGYGPLDGAPAGFLATPVVDKGTTLGVLAFRMPAGEINRLMQQTEGMGRTGETYLVGADGLLRTPSRFQGADSILRTKIASAGFQAAMAGESGLKEIVNYLGRPTVSAHAPLDFLGVRWAVIAEVSAAEALAPAEKLLGRVALIAVALVVVFVGLSVVVSRGIAGPIGRITTAMQRLAEGDGEVEVPDADQRDEVGEMARALVTFREGLAEKQRLEQAQKEAEAREAERRREAMQSLAAEFDSRIGEIAQAVQGAAARMREMAGQLAAAVEETSAQTGSASAAAQQTDTNVQSAASAVEELANAIQEIARNVERTSEAARACSGAAERSQRQLDGLQSAIGEIDGVIEAINDVAEQTNLLALNATIEAARAGEAGKGFAVVAGEVKSLARQTHDMTDEIRGKVEGVKESAGAAIAAINDILDQIANVDAKATSVAGSVEQQSAATREISRNVHDAASGTSEVSRSIRGIEDAARHGAESTATVKTAADDLAAQADGLKQAVDGFLAQIRAG